MRILVCGGRDFNDVEFIEQELDKFLHLTHIDCIIEGDARGVDRIAGEWAVKNKIENIKFPADWTKHQRAAGPIRNKQMIVEGQPDIVIAYPGGKGTSNMIEQAHEYGIEVVEVGR